MNWVDFAILAALAWFTYAAFNAGLIREVVTIVGAVAAVAFAGLFYIELATDVMVAVEDEQTSRIIAFAMIFGATVLASQLIAFFLKQVAALFLLGGLDKLGGAALGFLKGFVFVEIALIVALTFPKLGVEDAVHSSEIAPLFLNVLPFLKGLLPDEFRSAIDSF